MTADAAVAAMCAALDVAGVPYMVVGSLASNFHGIPRATRDVNSSLAISLRSKG